jgi:hypothetical protein
MTKQKQNQMRGLGLARIIVGLLVIQFLLGVVASMNSDVPEGHPMRLFLTLHIVNGTLLLILGGVFLYKAIKGKRFKREASSGLGAMVVAYAFGEAFVFTQNDLLSFLMAISFIGALMPYARVMYLTQPK